MFKFYSIIAILVLSILIFPVKSAKAADSVDRSCDGSGSPLTASIGTGSWQTFTPSQNRLSKVSVDVFRNDNNANVMVGVTLKVSHDIGRSSVVVDAGSKKVAPGGATLVYDFTDIEVTPNEPYRITLTTTGDVGWREQDDQCYRGGDAYWNSKITDPRFDYGFATYGYTVEDQPPVSALDLDEDVDQPVATDINEQNQSNDTPVSSATSPTSTNPTANNITNPSKSQTIATGGMAEKTNSIIGQIPFVADENGNTSPAFWYVVGSAGLAIIIAIGLYIYLRIKKKKQENSPIV